ncbi:Platelet-activating factor acetylhydrolase [Perkinsus chesapeaki]|uniref:1-alkyl-2-acetylglycerophosphocholine esterase n=1 Tax=Perkinsus chesapeaki TaxID=330153 RepID=A0A7J6LE27_PERCH|nr:Platelet-activating factor acetylhydrolase [Perkinsus chesapeaki]
MDPPNDISDVFQEATRTKNQIDDLLNKMGESSYSSGTTAGNRSASASSESEVAVQQRLAMLTQQLDKLIARLEELAKGPQGTPMWRKRAGRMREDLNGIKMSTDRLLNHIFRTRQREKLFGGKSSTDGGSEDSAESQLLRERQALQQSAGMLDSILGQGHATLGKMTQQNSVLKNTRRKMYDVLNAVGLSSTLSTSIDRRQRVDAWIVKGGMLAVGRALFRNSKVGQLLVWILDFVVKICAYILPSRLFIPKLPATFDRAEPVKESPLPLVVFSHGLTGNGDENSMLCSALTREIVGGAIVVEIHHQDGSACEAMDDEGRQIPYIPDPVENPTPKELRPLQVRMRANEMKSVIEYFVALHGGKEVSTDPLLNEVSALIDPNRIVPVGYSFGGATVAEYCSTVGVDRIEDKSVSCAVLMDPWTYVTPRDGTDGFRFPEKAHEDGNEGIQTPTLILSSEEFSNYPNMSKATNNLCDKSMHPGSRLRMIDHTRHGNFMELCYWLPRFLIPLAAAAGFYDRRNPSARAYSEASTDDSSEPVAAVAVNKSYNDILDRIDLICADMDGLVIPATGRSRASAAECFSKGGIDLFSRPGIYLNGAVTYDHTGAVVAESVHTYSDVAKAVKVLDGLDNVVMLLYSRDRVLAPYRSEKIIEIYNSLHTPCPEDRGSYGRMLRKIEEESIPVNLIHFMSLEGPLERSMVDKIRTFADIESQAHLASDTSTGADVEVAMPMASLQSGAAVEDIRRFVRERKKLGSGQSVGRVGGLPKVGRSSGCSAAQSLWRSSDVVPAGVSKALGVQVLKQLGYERVACIGDAMNDYEMLKTADVAVAMGNALPEIKKIASIEVNPNSDVQLPGVADLIDRTLAANGRR